jgi:hypothetical protein
MLSDLEAAIVSVEGVDPATVLWVKDAWEMARAKASSILYWPDKLIVEYNPAIWRISRFPVGIRLFSSPWIRAFVFEFASPNSRLPFDCFPSEDAKLGVMIHEIAHLIDDNAWNFDLPALIRESREYVTREQRAELLAFASAPCSIFRANQSLIESTMRALGLPRDKFQQEIRAMAAVETLGRIGMERSSDLVKLYEEIEEEGLPAYRILEEYISTNAFSLAGLTTAPHLNESRDYGIKRARDLTMARAYLCRYLRGQMDRSSLVSELSGLGYKVRKDEAIKDYKPLSCIELGGLQAEPGEMNRSRARGFFGECAAWSCFQDLERCLEDIEDEIERSS